MRRLLDSHQQAQVSKGDAAFLNGLKDALVHESGLAHIGTQQYWEAVQVRHFIYIIVYLLRHGHLGLLGGFMPPFMGRGKALPRRQQYQEAVWVRHLS